MAFTRFHDDPARIEKSLLESTFTGIYHLNTPGNGKSVFVETPHIRMQGGGSNLQTNPFEVNESLRRNKSLVKYDQFCTKPETQKREYSSLGFGVDESRTSLPAWTFRDKQQYRPNHLFMDPQKNIWYKFDNNCPTRMLEKDHYTSNYY
jgi:hypothetical protein